MKKIVLSFCALLLVAFASAEILAQEKSQNESQQSQSNTNYEEKISMTEEEYKQEKKYLQEQKELQQTKTSADNTNSSDKVQAYELVNEQDRKAYEKQIEQDDDPQELVLKVGKTISSETKMNASYGSLYSETIKDTDNDGFAIKADYFYYVADRTAVGSGLEFNYIDNDTKFLDIYAHARQNFLLTSINNTDLLFYVSAGFGYGIYLDSQKYYLEDLDVIYECKGGFDFVVSAGFDFDPFVLEFSFSKTYIKFDFDDTNLKIDGDYTKYLISLGYKIAL